MLKKNPQLKGALLLLLAALFWGTTFVAQSAGMESVQAFTFTGIRSLIGAAALLLLIVIRDAVKGRRGETTPLAERRQANRKVARAGFFIGLALCAASNLQQFAFNYTSAGKIAFITALYMFFVPVFGLLLGKRIPGAMWICVLFGFVGLYFLSVDPAAPLSLNFGDLLAFACAVMYAVHILMIERFAPDVDVIKLSFVQFLTCGTISCILMMIFEAPTVTAIFSAVPHMLYAGVMSCAVAFTLQIIGQKYAEATVASLIMCTESVIGAVSAAILLGERLLPREAFGCALMFAAIVLSQFADALSTHLKMKRKKRA